MIKRLLLALPLLVFALSCSAAEDTAPSSGPDTEQNFVAGTHYDIISPPVRSTSPGKIEVAEFFWYGCGHCYSFEPIVGEWKKTIAEDVQFRGIPAIWNEGMDLHAKAFYTAEALGVSETMNSVIFQAMNVDRKRLSSESEIGALFTANGVSEADFSKTFSSFGIASQVRQAMATAKGAKISGTPALMVNGKYHISARKAGGQAQMLQVADYLVAKERALAAK